MIFAFIGQGAPLGERTCLFASDSTFKDRGKNAVAATEIEEETDIYAFLMHELAMPFVK